MNNTANLSAPIGEVFKPISEMLENRIGNMLARANALEQKLGGLFGEGNAENRAVPRSAGAFNAISGHLDDLEMTMNRVENFVSRI